MSEKRKDRKGRLLNYGETQRSDGRYQYRYTDSLGNRKIEYSWKLVSTDKTPTGKKQDLSLREKEKEIQQKLNSGLTINKTSLNEMFSYYLKRKKYKGKILKDTTINNYISMWEKNIKSEKIGNMKVSSIKRSHIINLFFKLQNDGLSYGTIKFFYRLLNAIFNMAIDDSIILTNPVKRTLNEIVGRQKRREALTIEQQKELIEYARKNNYIMYTRIIFMLETMCRISEMSGITWSCIDMENRIVNIDHQLQYLKTEKDEKARFRITPTKSESGNRKIPMTDNVYIILKEMKQYYFITKKAIEVDGYKDFVFLTSQGKLINTNNFNRELKAFINVYNETAQNKIDNISSHILRHTGCTRKAEKGMDIKVLQYLMGHNNYAVTMDVYNHVNEDRAKSNMIKIELSEV